MPRSLILSFALGAAVAVVACRTFAPGTGPAVASEPAPASEPAAELPCPQRVARLKSWMDTWLHLPYSTVVTDAKLISRPGTPWLKKRTFILEVMPDRVLLEGQPVAQGTVGPGPITGLTALLHKHRVRLAKIRKLTRGKLDIRLDRVLLLVDAKATWGAVAAVAATLLAEKISTVGLVFDVPHQVKKPGPSSMDRDVARLQGLPPARRQEEVARLWAKQVHPCRPLAEGLASLAAADPSQGQSQMVAVIPGALRLCQCKVDLPAFKTLLFTTFYTGQPKGVAWITLQPKAARVSLPAGTPWSAAHKQLLEAGETVSIGVKK